MKTLKLNDTEIKEIQEKEKAEKDDPVKISHKYLRKVNIIYLICYMFREEKLC